MEASLIKIDSELTDPEYVLGILAERGHGTLATTQIIKHVPNEVLRRINTISSRRLVIVRNDTVPLIGSPPQLNQNWQYPLCSLHTQGYTCTPKSLDEALRVGNFLLCTKGVVLIEDIEGDNPDEDDSVGGVLSSKQVVSKYAGETYRIHVDADETTRYHTKYPAYVNHDRTSDNVGGSSWDGSLTRWFRAGFTTRVRYAVESGLFPSAE